MLTFYLRTRIHEFKVHEFDSHEVSGLLRCSNSINKLLEICIYISVIVATLQNFKSGCLVGDLYA